MGHPYAFAVGFSFGLARHGPIWLDVESRKNGAIHCQNPLRGLLCVLAFATVRRSRGGFIEREVGPLPEQQERMLNN